MYVAQIYKTKIILNPRSTVSEGFGAKRTLAVFGVFLQADSKLTEYWHVASV